MSTPTNHTSITSFFNECEPGPEESQISLDSSIEDSNILEHSAHSRFSVLSNILGRPRAASGGQSLLGPLEEGLEGSEVPSLSLSKNSSDAENKFASSNQQRANPNKDESKRSNIDNNKTTASVSAASGNSGGGILKQSRFSGCSVPPPPPNPPPSKLKQTTFKQVQERQLQQRHEVPILSVTTVLGDTKSEETDTAFLNSLNTNTTANTPMNSTATNTPLGAERSQRTNATFGQVPGDVPSETIHTSNLRSNSVGAVGSFHATEDDTTAASAIHLALIFFCGLVVASVLISFTVIRKYGLITLMGLLLLLLFLVFLAVFVDRTILSKHPKLRPIRTKIAAVVAATKVMLVEEYYLLIRDWNEHLLLTRGEEQHQSFCNEEKISSTRLSMPLGRKMSKIFKVIKPFLGLKKKLFRGSNQKGQNYGAGVKATSDIPYNREVYYSPPSHVSELKAEASVIA